MNEKNTKSVSNSKIKWIVLAVLLVIFIALIPAGYALFSDHKKDTTEAKVGKIEVILKEDWPDMGETYGNDDEYDEFGIQKYTKKIWGQSVGNLPAYVRVRCIPIVEYYVEPEEGETQGQWITAPVDQDSILLSVTAKDNEQNATWLKGGEYWYYKNILPAGEDTAPINVEWTVTDLPNGLSGKRIRTDVRVILEYAQTTHDKWKELFQIDALPDGVELAE